MLFAQSNLANKKRGLRAAAYFWTYSRLWHTPRAGRKDSGKKIFGLFPFWELGFPKWEGTVR